MSINNEGIPTPGSIEAEALAALEKEGQTIEGKQPPAVAEPKATETPKVVEQPKEQPKEETPKEQPKVDRTPSMVETWKLRVAEEQKEAALKKATELEAKLEELSKQKSPITQAQEKDIAEEIKALAGDKEVDVEFLTKFADTIIKKTESKYKPNNDIESTVKKLQEERELQVQLNEYNSEFEKDVLPLVKDYNLSDTALSELKTNLRDLAFSEIYAKVPLKEIFQIKQSNFNLQEPKKASEGKGIKARATDTIDLDNVDEETFAKMTPEQIEAFGKRHSGSWNTRK